MASAYDELRAAVEALVAAPGHVTRAAVQALLERHPPTRPPDRHDVFDDAIFDPSIFG